MQYTFIVMLHYNINYPILFKQFGFQTLVLCNIIGNKTVKHQIGGCEIVMAKMDMLYDLGSMNDHRAI